MQDCFAEVDRKSATSSRPINSAFSGEYQNPRDSRLRLSDVTGMFETMRDVVGDD